MRCALVLATLLVSAPCAAQEVVLFPGAAREISHAMSASPDTGIFAIQFFPFPSGTAGADFAVVGVLAPSWAARFGLFGMLEVHSACPWADCGTGLWRGLGGGSLAFAAKLRKLTVEATVNVRHESEHTSNGTEADYPLPAIIMDNFVMPDLALRIPMGDLVVELRAQAKIFFGEGERYYGFGPGGDAILRWRLHPRVHPFWSTFGEHIWGEEFEVPEEERGTPPFSLPPRFAVPNLYTIRSHLGAIFPFPYEVAKRSITAELHLFGFFEVGHGEGLRKLQREARLGMGMRGELFP